MLYTHAKFWRFDGEIWHALTRQVPGAGCTDLSMSKLSERDYRKTRAWAEMHKLAVDDCVAA